MLIIRHIVGDQALQRETVGHLGRKHRVDDRFGDHLLDIFPRGHLVGVLVVAGDPAADDHPLQVPLAANLLSYVVNPPRELHAAKLGIDHDLDAVERVALRIVIADVAVVGNFLPVVPGGLRIVLDDQAARRSRQLSVDLDADLPFGKDLQLAFDLVAGPGLQPRKAPQMHLHQRVVILHAKRADNGVALKIL